MNKTIVIAVNTSWNIYNFRLNLVREIKKEGYRVVIVAPYDKYSDILSKEFEYYNIDIDNKGINPIEDIKSTFKFYKLYKNIKPDIVLNFTIKPNIYGAIVCKILKIKVINNITGLGTLFIKNGFTTKIAIYLYRVSQKNIDKIFFQNREDFEFFLKNRIIKREQADILPGSGVDISKFKPLKVKRDNKKILFLHTSRMIWEKGIKEYVEVAKLIKKEYKNVEFYLLGFLDVENPSAISRSDIDRWVEDGTINYLGVTDDVRDFIKRVDCIVLASYYREGTPRTLLEGASMAKPIITTNNVGCRDVVDDGYNGFICKPKDINSLYKCVKKFILLDSKTRELMGKRGRKKILKEFNDNIITKKYLNNIAVLVGKKLPSNVKV